mgnify:CR=1 FL=1
MSTMLPATPKTFGDIRHVFSSAFSALQGAKNPLALPPAKQAVVVLVDGLGSHNIRERSGHAPFLLAALKAGKSISAGFPTTTAASISSFATGLAPSESGIVAYKILDRPSGEVFNMLTGWGDEFPVATWQPHQTVSQKAVAAGIETNVIGAAEYSNSGFTQATMPEVNYIAAKGISQSFDAASKLLVGSQPSLTYLYVPYLDQCAHQYGWQSPKWSELLEELDSSMRQLSLGLRKGQGVLLTADHGVVDIPFANHIYLDEIPELAGQLEFVGGDTRAPMLYLKSPEAQSSVQEALERRLNSVAWVLSREQLLDAGWYGPMSDDVAARLGDITIVAKSNVVFYERNFASAKSLKMVGHHGAMSSEELQIPLIRLGQFA